MGYNNDKFRYLYYFEEKCLANGLLMSNRYQLSCKFAGNFGDLPTIQQFTKYPIKAICYKIYVF